MSSLYSTEFMVLEFREFKPGGSCDRMVNSSDTSAPGEKQNFEPNDGQIELKVDELMGIDGDEDGMEINSSSMIVGPPLLESVHKASQSPSEHAVARFLSCYLKRIDPALQSRQRANGEAKEIAEAKFLCDKAGGP
ncbi:hypothetical protein CMV_025404 [Castanea mollissima]|uniref:Uncharacterized protein n=1 Tax=Castanea mollissima TaxID=60419 RepID=A0A8J4V8N5_9ROSI|nr:hypothetical protein CMV_025404 [Castanea mollissima]